MVLELLVSRALDLGARLAKPGEFTERAFLNGKIDLAQAEAVADLIDSGSRAAARSALRSLRGEFSRQVTELVEAVSKLRTHVEADIDFPDEEIDFLADTDVAEAIDALLGRLSGLLATAEQGCLLRDGMRVVIAGPPNSGKSSLMNKLAMSERAIVSEAPGTTRDIVDLHMHVDGLPLHLLDTAGLRETVDAVEREGVTRAWSAMREADRVLIVVDDTTDVDVSALIAQLPDLIGGYTIVRNKIDLTQRAPGHVDGSSGSELALSAKTEAGLDELRRHLKQCMGFQTAGETSVIARSRHVEAVRVAEQRVQTARHCLQTRHGELLAEELRLAQKSLSEITGEFTADDLLGRIFASFCIGK